MSTRDIETLRLFCDIIQTGALCVAAYAAFITIPRVLKDKAYELLFGALEDWKNERKDV